MVPISATNLKARRRQAILTQQELAARTGLSRVGIAKLETTQVSAHASTVRKLAQALNCDPKDLVNVTEQDDDK
jgi:transcriptional regulator with XRE-family HTH domain